MAFSKTSKVNPKHSCDIEILVYFKLWPSFENVPLAIFDIYIHL